LREGLRSYHANGYLVALNYPEITVSMVAKRLMTLPPNTRVAVLKTAKELKPLFERFGASTMLETLEHESRTYRLSFGGKVPPARPFLVRDLDMPYVISFPGSSEFSTLYAAQIELVHGVLYVDGQYCPQASFQNRSLTWSRQVLDRVWEHGHCEFYNNGQQAFGHIFHANEDEALTEDKILGKAISFEMTPGILDNVQSPAPAWALASHAAETAANTAPEFRAEESEAFEAPLAISAPAQPLTRTVALNTVVGGSTRRPASFALSYDPSPYNPNDQTRSNPTIRCGTILLPTEANRFAFAKLALDDYDQVQTRLLAKAQAENARNSSASQNQFYKHTIRYDARQVEYHKFELLQAHAMIEASDEYVAWKAANPTSYLDMDPPVKNLHYTSLGLDASFVIPELFKTVELEKSLPDASGLIGFSGVAKTYSATAEGNEGDAHVIVGTYVKPTTTTVASAAQHAVSMATSSQAAVTSAHKAPHVSAMVLARSASSIPAGKEERLQALGNIPLDLTAVNSSAQTTMTNIMQWHMKPEDRKLFFGAADKPSGLPAELTTAIENTPEADWIRDTYAKAHVCQIMSQSDAQIREQYRFTKEEKKNIKYFWTGNGPNCLAKSSVYRKLERAISRYELRKRYEIIGAIHEESAGVEYSNDLYTRYTGPFTIGDLATINPTTGTSLMSKICTIMDALDDGAENERPIDSAVDSHKMLVDTNANHLVIAATAYQKGAVWMTQYWGLKSDSERDQMLEDTWLEDTLRDLVSKLLAQDPSISGPVSTALSDALKKYSDSINNWAKMGTADKLKHVMIDIGDRLQDVMKGVGKMLGWVGKGAQAVWQKGRQIVAAWRNNAAALGDAIDHVLQEKPVGFVKGPLFGSLMFLVGMTALGVTIWNASDKWSDASTSDRGLMITTVVAALNQMAEFGVDAVYSIMRYKKGAFSEAAELAIHAELDAISGLRLGSKWASVLEDPLVTGATRIRDVQQIQDFKDTLFWGSGESTEHVLRNDRALSKLRDLTPIKRSFNIARSVLAIIGCVAAVGLAIFMTWSLVHDWTRLDPSTRVFQTLLTALQWIEASVALVVIGVCPAFSTILPIPDNQKRSCKALLTSEFSRDTSLGALWHF